MIFQDGWRGKVHGPASFVRVFVIEFRRMGAAALCVPRGRDRVRYVANTALCHAPHRSAPLRNGLPRQPQLDEATHGVGAAVGGLLGRIVIMQCAVIFGGMLAQKYGSNAPMYIVIGLKLLSDLGGKPLRGATITTKSGSGKNATVRTIKLPDDTSPS